MDAMQQLSAYDRVTLGLWSRSHAELTHPTPDPTPPSGLPGQSTRSYQAAQRLLAQAATHALLARLRPCGAPEALFARYQAEDAADLAMIASLLEQPSEELLWRVRDAAFHLRWRELTAGAPAQS